MQGGLHLCLFLAGVITSHDGDVWNAISDVVAYVKHSWRRLDDQSQCSKAII